MAPRSKTAPRAVELKSPGSDGAASKLLRHKRRYCRAEGCNRIVKSQGLCQRHGAKPKKCRVEGCHKQAQGNFDGMCKSHFKAFKRQATPLPAKPDPQVAEEPPPPEGESVYDRILPASIAWQPVPGREMPLIEHLKEGFLAQKPPAWHRNEERRARGLWPVHNPATQLEGWERELVWMEILVLTGNPESSFRHLARGWGRDKGFHMVLAQFICERHGDVERKKRERGASGRGKKQGGDFNVGADIWDSAVYGDGEYNEALAADLLTFSVGERMNSAERVLAEEFKNHQDDDREGVDELYHSSGETTSPSNAGEADEAISPSNADENGHVDFVAEV